LEGTTEVGAGPARCPFQFNKGRESTRSPGEALALWPRPRDSNFFLGHWNDRLGFASNSCPKGKGEEKPEMGIVSIAPSTRYYITFAWGKGEGVRGTEIAYRW